MSELKQFDETINNEDEYETPSKYYNELIYHYNVRPKLDVAATRENRKCLEFFDKKADGLRYRWLVDVWCNPPHTRTEDFVRKALREWQDHNIDIMMIIPTNTMSARFWHECIEGYTEYHPIEGRIKFLQHGKPSKQSSRNAYVCVIWRKRN